MNIVYSICSLIIAMTMALNGCASLLPSVKNTTQSPWQSFTEAKQEFDKIVPNQTTREDLKSMGFDPFETANVNLITYLDLIQKFMPNPSIKLEDLDPGIQACLRAREACQGYEVSPKVLNARRYGNVLLDLFNFRRKQETRGWHFVALLVLQDDLVIYKLWGGEPNISQFEDKKNPLGPFQNIGDILPPIKFN